MDRPVRTKRIEEPAPSRPQRKEKVSHAMIHLGMMKCPWSYQCTPGAYYIIRRYYVGKQQFAFVKDWAGTKDKDRFEVATNSLSRYGNAMKSFEDEASLHAFLEKELTEKQL